MGGTDMHRRLQTFFLRLRFLAGVCVISIGLLTACGEKKVADTGEPEVDEIIENVSTPKLEFWIADNVDQVDFSAYTRRYGLMGGKEYYGTGYVPTLDEDNHQVDPERCVVYTVTSYPDYADKEQYITGIYITDPEIEIYGITTESSIEEFTTQMEKYGFSISLSGDYSVLAQKGKSLISLNTFDKCIRIRVEISNRDGIVF